MKRSSAEAFGLIALVLLALLPAGPALAGIITTTDPGGTTTEIAARIRWGGTGFEASIFDNNPFAQSPTLNPTGSPVWVVGNAYQFAVAFDSTTGTLTLSVDFNRDASFGTGEVISRNVFSTPPRTDYTGYGFNYLSISGNESGSTARSTVSNLNINGASLPSLAPNGAFLEQFYLDTSGNPLPVITITGSLTFSSAGTAQERPSWNFNLKDSATVPDGGATLVLLGCALMGLGALRRRFGA